VLSLDEPAQPARGRRADCRTIA